MIEIFVVCTIVPLIKEILGLISYANSNIGATKTKGGDFFTQALFENITQWKVSHCV